MKVQGRSEPREEPRGPLRDLVLGWGFQARETLGAKAGRKLWDSAQCVEKWKLLGIVEAWMVERTSRDVTNMVARSLGRWVNSV